MPVSYVIRIKPDTKTTYIVPVSIESAVVHIRSLDEGNLHYAIDVPLAASIEVMRALDSDERIEDWKTEESAPVCPRHTHFNVSNGDAA